MADLRRVLPPVRSRRAEPAAAAMPRIRVGLISRTSIYPKPIPACAPYVPRAATVSETTNSPDQAVERARAGPTDVRLGAAERLQQSPGWPALYLLGDPPFRKWCRSLGFPESQIQPPTCTGQGRDLNIEVAVNGN